MTIAAGDITASSILRQTFDLLRANALRSITILLVLAALGAAIDTRALGEGGDGLLNLVLSVLTLVAQYSISRALLDETGMLDSTRGRFGAFFVLLLLSTLIIGLGLVLLIVPGLILATRWSMSVPILLGSGEGIIDSLRQSWAETRGLFWPILVALAVIYVAGFGTGLGIAAMETLGLGLSGVVLRNLLIESALVVGWHASVAIYLLARPRSALTEVFA